MLANLIAESTHVLGETYPGGASADDPAPANVAYYANAWQYGIIALIVLLGMLFLVTRLNADR